MIISLSLSLSLSVRLSLSCTQTEKLKTKNLYTAVETFKIEKTGIDEYMQALDSGMIVKFPTQEDAYVVAGVLYRFLQLLPDLIIPKDLSHEYKLAVQMPSGGGYRDDQIHALNAKMPAPHASVLYALCKHFEKVAACFSDNRISSVKTMVAALTHDCEQHCLADVITFLVEHPPLTATLTYT